MGSYRIEISAETGKTYINSETGRKLAVWRLASVVAKLREAKATGDTDLSEAMRKMSEKYESIKAENDAMRLKWFEDCSKVWETAHDQVLVEPAPQVVSTKPSLFKRKQA